MTYIFGEYQLDTQLFELRRNGYIHPLEPQVFDILAYLVSRRDRVVTKDELYQQIWKDRIVSESTLNNRIMGARKAVGDSGSDQRLIATVRGRGFRFVAPVEEKDPAFGEEVAHGTQGPDFSTINTSTTFARQDLPAVASTTARRRPGGEPGRRYLEYAALGEGPVVPVGREVELAFLQERLDRMKYGARREVVFVTGETGAGKTTLVDSFLNAAVHSEDLWVLHGHCLEHRGTGEAYMPVLEALGRACRSPGGHKLISVLSRHAPTWLIQMPWLISRDELFILRESIAGSTRERMLREMVEALETLAASQPVILVLEDLHWSDYSTLDLIDRLARHAEPARMLLVVTFRPPEVQQQGHPLVDLMNELSIHRRCEELRLPLLNLPDVEAYLAARFPGAIFPDGFARLVHDRTDGNPLFMGNILDYWIAKGLLKKKDGRWSIPEVTSELAQGIPESLRHLVEQKLVMLGRDDQSVLEAAAVVGVEFEAAAVAPALERPDEEVEERCSVMARHGQFLYAGGIANWIDGTVSARFRFIHHLYQEVLYDRVPAWRRRLYHRRIGLRLEAAYADEAPNHAHELGVHFVYAGDAVRAVRYLKLSADQALRRSAQREALDQLRKAHELLRHIPDDGERLLLELGIQSALGSAFVILDGWGSREAEEAFLRARTLSEKLDDHPGQVQVLYQLAILYEYRGEFQRSQELMEGRLRLAESSFLPEAHELLACSKFYQGKFDRSLEHARRGLSIYETQTPLVRQGYWGHNSGILCHDWAALALWFLGYADQAREEARLAVRLAESPENQHSLSNVHLKTAILSQCLLDAGQTAEWAASAVDLATQQGFHYRVGVGMVLEGWAQAVLGENAGALERISEGLKIHESTGALMDRPYVLGLMADACLRSGKSGDGLAALDDAQSILRNGRRFFYEPELHRLRGLLMLQSGSGLDGAEVHLLCALDAARRQRSKSLELRSAVNLAELWFRAGRGQEASELIEPLYAGFTEGFGNHDLTAAARLLERR